MSRLTSGWGLHSSLALFKTSLPDHSGCSTRRAFIFSLMNWWNESLITSPWHREALGRERPSKQRCCLEYCLGSFRNSVSKVAVLLREHPCLRLLSQSFPFARRSFLFFVGFLFFLFTFFLGICFLLLTLFL